MSNQLFNSNKPVAPVVNRTVSIGLADFLATEFPPRTYLLEPWLSSQALTMVYASRGVGKTFFALSVACAVANGSSFLGYSAPKPAGVLYIDGEMPASMMQERLASIIGSSGSKTKAPFDIVTPDLQGEGMPRLDTLQGQYEIEQLLTDEHKLIVVDNISTLTAGKENEADSWTPMQDWALRMRASGRSVLFIHHAGKGGNQRGTSRREDTLDTVIALRRPKSYDSSQGAVFEIHFEKARSIHGEDVKPVEATLEFLPNGNIHWKGSNLEDSTFEKIISMLNKGLAQNEIAEELGIHKSNVSRHSKKAREAGLLTGG